MATTLEGECLRVSDDEALEPGKTARVRPEFGSNAAILAMAELRRSHPNFTDIVRKAPAESPKKGEGK